MDSTSSAFLHGHSLAVASEPGSRTSCLTRPCGGGGAAFRPQGRPGLGGADAPPELREKGLHVGGVGSASGELDAF